MNNGLGNKAALIEDIHNSGCRIVLHITGGGMSAVPDLLAVAGASRTILDLTIPYSPAALAQLIGSDQTAAVSERSAMRLAESAFSRALELSNATISNAMDNPSEHNLAGIGCTAALTTDRERRGTNRAHIAMRNSVGTTTWFLDLSDEVGADRASQDRRVGDAVVLAVAAACGVARDNGP